MQQQGQTVHITSIERNAVKKIGKQTNRYTKVARKKERTNKSNKERQNITRKSVFYYAEFWLELNLYSNVKTKFKTNSERVKKNDQTHCFLVPC